MVNALLISYPGEPINPTTFLPDNGLASLAGTLIEEGHNAYILDYGTVDFFFFFFPENVRECLLEIYEKKIDKSLTKSDESKLIEIDKKISIHQENYIDVIGNEIIDFISKKSIDFVGFKPWMGDAYDGFLRLAEIIKSHYKKIPIIVGGPQVVSFSNTMIKHGKNIDFFCYDEGELTIKKLAEYIKGNEQLDNIPNILFEKNGRVTKSRHKTIEDLDQLALPIYNTDVYPAMANDQKFKMVVIDESRRCYYSCPFCIESSKEKSKWRSKSSRRIVDEIKNVKEKYGINLVRFGGQMTPGNLMEDFSKLLLEENVNIEFSSFSHISTMKDVDFEIMKKAGLYSLFFGIESGNQKMLSTTLGKKTKVEDIEKVLRSARKAGIYTVASLIYPAPGDNEETLNDTVDLIVKTGVKSAPVQFAGIYPGTKWAREYSKFGFEMNPDTYESEVINYKIKNIFPPDFWDPLPVKIDGKSFFEYISETERMILSLENNGILTDITDEQALLAKHADITPRELRDASKRIFYIGDWEKMQELIKKVNSHK